MSTRNAQHTPGNHQPREESNFESHRLKCIGKGRFRTRAKADDMIRAYSQLGIWKRAYGCRLCRGYHLSSKERKS
jgi:hypothetical protein